MILWRYAYIFSFLTYLGYVLAGQAVAAGPQEPDNKDARAPSEESAPAKTPEETVLELLQKLKELDISTDIRARLNQETKTITVKMLQGNTVISIELDPYATDIFFDIQIKRRSGVTPPAISAPAATGPSPTLGPAAPAPPRTPPSPIQEEITKMIKAIGKRHIEETTGNVKRIPLAALNHLYRAQRHYGSKSYRAALAEVEKSLELGKTPLGYALQGTIFIALNRTKEAIAAWKKALDLDPTMGEVEAAIKQYEEEVNEEPPAPFPAP